MIFDLMDRIFLNKACPDPGEILLRLAQQLWFDLFADLQSFQIFGFCVFKPAFLLINLCEKTQADSHMRMVSAQFIPANIELFS